MRELSSRWFGFLGESKALLLLGGKNNSLGTLGQGLPYKRLNCAERTGRIYLHAISCPGELEVVGNKSRRAASQTFVAFSHLFPSCALPVACVAVTRGVVLFNNLLPSPLPPVAAVLPSGRREAVKIAPAARAPPCCSFP